MARDDRIIYGIHAVLEAVEAGRDLDKVLLKQGEGSGQLKNLAAALRQKGIHFQRVPAEALNRITRKNHQGVVAWLSHITYQELTGVIPSVYESGEDPLVLILDGISDVRNFGAIARSAECAGVHAIVIPASGSAAINADAIKTSAGALHRIPVCRHRELLESITLLKESGLRIYAASEKGARSLYETDLRGPAGIILGSEELGVSGKLLKDSDQVISIPMKGSIASLNVSVAAGIILYEVIRQRDLPVS